MSDTTHLGLPLLAGDQAQKHVTHNEALILLDHAMHLAVISRTLAAPPATPGEGDRYLIAAAASGAWTGHDGELAFYQDGVWRFAEPKPGWRLWSIAEEKFLVFDGTLWRDLQELDELQNLSVLGVNTIADATNKLAVRSNAILLTALAAADGGNGDLQAKFNKETAGDTAALLFQTGFSGRAEFGLAGDDDFHLKVSPDGAAWTEALVVDRATGRATFALSPERLQLDVFTASDTYDVPSWARHLRIVCVGGGGGGGAGAAGSNASNRFGGTGGAAGGRAEEVFDVDELDPTLTIAIGTGGTGGAGVTGNTSGNPGNVGGETSVSSGGDTVLVAGGGSPGIGGATAASNSLSAGGTGNRNSNSGQPSQLTVGIAPVTQGDSPGGGGPGGALSTAGVANAGGDGGIGYFIGGSGRRSERGTGGSTGGGAGGVGQPKGFDRGCGSGGGGGGANTSGNAGSGGDGGEPGGGGGGGGASRDTATSGSGGDGGRGEVWIIAIG